jgi:hypothetical protein
VTYLDAPIMFHNNSPPRTLIMFNILLKNGTGIDFQVDKIYLMVKFLTATDKIDSYSVRLNEHFLALLGAGYE